jgi:hypothetical protein
LPSLGYLLQDKLATLPKPTAALKMVLWQQVKLAL